MSRTEKKEKSPRGIRLIMHYFILFVIVYKRHFEQKHKRGSRKVLRRIFKFKIISAGANVIHECGLPKLGSSGICIQLEPTKNMSSKSQQSSRAQVWITRMLQDVAAGVLAEVRSCFLLLNQPLNCSVHPNILPRIAPSHHTYNKHTTKESFNLLRIAINQV